MLECDPRDLKFYDDNFLEWHSRRWEVEDQSSRQKFIRCCQTGMVCRTKCKVSNFTLEFGFWHASHRGHRCLVNLLVKRVSQVTVDNLFREDLSISVGMLKILLPRVSSGVKRERFLEACSLGEDLVAESIARKGELSSGLILEGIDKAIQFKHDSLVLLLCKRLPSKDRLVVLKKALETERQELVGPLACQFTGLGDVFVRECQQGRLNNVKALSGRVRCGAFEKGFDIAVRSKHYDVVDYLAQDSILGYVFVIDRLRIECRSNGPAELIVCLFSHLDYAEDKQFIFNEAYKNNCLKAIRALLNQLPASECNQLITNVLSSAILLRQGTSAMVLLLVSKASLADQVCMLKKLCSISGYVDSFRYILQKMFLEETTIHDRQDIVIQGAYDAMKADEFEKVELFEPYVDDQDCLDKMFDYARRRRSVSLFQSLIRRVSRRSYDKGEASLLKYSVIANNFIDITDNRAEWLPEIADNEVSENSVIRLRLVDNRLQRMVEIMKDYKRERDKEGVFQR